MPDTGSTSPDDPAWVDDIVRRALERAGSGEAADTAASAGTQTASPAAPPAPQAAPPAPQAAPPAPAPTAPQAAPPAPQAAPPAPSPQAPPAPTAPQAAPPAPSPQAPPAPTAPQTAPPAPQTASEAATASPAPVRQEPSEEPRLPEPDDLVSAYPIADASAGLAVAGASDDTIVAGPYPDADNDELWGRAIAAEDAELATDPEDQGNRIRSFLEWGAVVVGALAVALVIKTFLMQAYFIPSESMIPTLEVGDRVLVNKLSYEFGDVGRGDLVVFNRPPSQTSGEDDLIKRVIALEGETIEIRENTVFITLPDSDTPQMLEEPYLVDGVRITGLVDTTNCDNPTPTTCTIPENHVFVMGDNRPGSRDGRAFGPISEDLIVGRAFLRVWPLGDISFL